MHSLKRDREESLLDHDDVMIDTSPLMTPSSLENGTVPFAAALAAKDVEIQILQMKLSQSETDGKNTTVQLAAMVKQSIKKPKKVRKNFLLRIADIVNCKSAGKNATYSPETRQ